MSFNPLEEKGIPLEQQLQSWDNANPQPYDKNNVHPYTRTRIILMNGIEVEGAIFKHQFARHCDDLELRRKIAHTRRIEQQQQKMVNWLIPGDQTNLEVTLGFEQVAVDLTAWLARQEPDANVKAALDYALLEDFDHLYRYANLYEMVEGKTAENVIGEDLTEVFPGRPTVNEHQHPADTIRPHVNADEADFLTLMHLLTIVAAEQQTMNLYMNVGNRPADRLGRGLYLEIAQIEEQHVSHYESLLDPTAGWFERAVLHEYNECFLYYSCLQSEVDERIRKMWQWHLDCEIDHLHRACEMLKEHGQKDPEELLPDTMPEPLVMFESNRDYVRQIEAEQVDWTTAGTDIVKGDQAPETYKHHQERINAGTVPSQKVIEEHIADLDEDYRLESKGEHPVERFRERNKVTR
jgi:rubrerythrin